MDPASAIIGIASFGFTVFGKVNEVRKIIKGAPEQLQSLEDSYDLVYLFLKRLQTAEAPDSLHLDAPHIIKLCNTGRRCLEEVKVIIDKVTVPGSTQDDGARRQPVRKLKLLRKNSDIVNVARKLKELEATLASLVFLVQLDSLKSAMPAVKQDDTMPGHSSVGAEGLRMSTSSLNSLRNNLRCLSNCACRCHHPSVVRCIPSWLAPYIGQITISKRLLHPTFASWSLCNVQTCRGNIHRALSLQWYTPFRLVHAHLQYTKNHRIHFCIGAPRIVSLDSPIFTAVKHGDLCGVRNLFATGQASIWDYTVRDLPVFSYACDCWQENPSEERLKIISLFVEAGAEVLLFEESQRNYSAHDSLILGLLGYLLDKTSSASRTPATIVRTNTVAIHFFRSLFNMDPMDALEDYLNRNIAQHSDIVGLLESLEDTERDPGLSRSSLFEAIGYTPLQYAIVFSPDRVESLLSDGEDAAADHTLVHVMGNAPSELIKPLLDAGADVNMNDSCGYTALHYACSRCCYDGFLELLRWAEGVINWDVRTPDGQTALQLLDSSISAGWAADLSHSQVDEFRVVLVTHMNVVEEEFSGILQPDMPGAFPCTS